MTLYISYTKYQMNKLRRVSGGIVTLAIVALPLIGFWQRQAIFDWWRLRNYSPPASIAALATDDQMTDQARRLFYINHPQLAGSVTDFRSNCTVAEQTIVLGCYQSDPQRIFIYAVKDDRLAGVTQVTAAHEMLHAAYSRLSSKDKDYVDGLIQNFYDNGLSNDRIKETINSYKKTEPNELLNEMHSIFATEITTLPTPLESYYQQYFKSRQAVVDFSNRYSTEFTSRIAQINTSEQQLNSLKQTITDKENSLNSQLAAVESDRRRLDSLKASGQISEYNAAVAGFNAQVDAYNGGVAQLRGYIAQYNGLVEAHNQLAAELRNLYSSIDTSLAPQTAQ